MIHRLSLLNVILGLGLVLTVGAAETVTIQPTPRFSEEKGSFLPNVCRRIRADGSLMASVVSVDSLGGQINVTDKPEILIDGSDGSALRWKLLEGEGQNFQVTVELDLGETYLINKIRTCWYTPTERSEKWTYTTSVDGKTFTPVKTVLASDGEPGSDAYWNLRFPARQARYLRMEASGISNPDSTQVSLAEICVFLAAEGVPPGIRDGYSIGVLPGVLPSYPEADVAWAEPLNILHGAAAPTSNLKPKPGWDKDSVAEYDLGAPYQVALMKLGAGLEKPCWQNGAKVQVEVAATGEWRTVWETEQAIEGSEVLTLPADLGPLRKVRLISRGGPEIGVNTDRLNFLEIFPPVVGDAAPKPVMTVTAQKGERFSAAVYDASGRQVKALATSREGTGEPVSLYWDGTDATGALLPAGEYEWRSLVNAPKAENIAAVGDSGKPPYGQTEALGGVTGVAYDAKGNMYQSAWWVEQHFEVRKSAPDGEVLWNRALVGAIALAVDENEVYVALSSYGKGEDRVYRLNAKDGKALPFPDGSEYLLVNENRPKEPPSNTLTFEQQHDYEPLASLALDADHLYVSNYLKDQVVVFDRATGQKRAELPVEEPLGVAARGGAAGTLLWVSSKDAVRVFQINAKHQSTEKTALRIKGGPRPQALGMAPDGNTLAVGDVEDGTVRIYALGGSGEATLKREIGRRATAGPLHDGDFRPTHRFGVALSPTGNLSVADGGNRMLWTFDSSGKLLATEFSEFTAQPVVYAVDGDIHSLLSGVWEYEVDLSGTAYNSPRWFKNGLASWRLAANWRPDDELFYNNQQSLKVKMPNGKDYMIFMGHTSRGLAIYQVTDIGLRRSFVLGTRWKGLDELTPEKIAVWTWTDKNGNGKFDWDPSKDDANAEGQFFQRPGEPGEGLFRGEYWQFRSPGAFVDKSGNLWFAQVPGGVTKIPLQGFDDHDNPIYDLAKAEVVIPEHTTPEDYMPNNLKIGPNGDIYTLGFSKATGGDRFLWMGGKDLRRYSPEGELLSSFLVPEQKAIVVFAFDPVNPDIFYTVQSEGANSEFFAWNKEGLCLARVKPDFALSGDIGWVDGGMGASVFSPDGKRSLLYAEDCWNGKIVLFEFANMQEKSRASGRIQLAAGKTIE